MIQSTLKTCCYECSCPNIEVDTVTKAMGLADYYGEKFCTIYCTHSQVCKDYIESEE